MKRLLTLLIPWVAGFLAIAQEPCKTAAECNRQGTAALKQANFDRATAMFEAEIYHAEKAYENASQLANPQSRMYQAEAAMVMAYNNLALTALQKKDYLRARVWARLALQRLPSDDASLHNLATAEHGLAKMSDAVSADGVYERYAGFGQWDTLCLRSEQNRSVKFALSALRVNSKFNEVGAAAMGSAGGLLKLADGRYEYRIDYADKPCTLRFWPSSKFQAVVIEQRGSSADCGFGASVYAQGEYLRTAQNAPQACFDQLGN
jgi:tetratricopeptide (TPR) repeat protein